MTQSVASRPLHAPLALVVDWGGVLTVPLEAAVQAWATNDGVELAQYVAIMRDWFGPAVGLEAELNPVHALERGELAVPDFEQRLAAEFARRSGHVVPVDGLVDRMMAHFELIEDVPALVRRIKQQGVKTALLSNSWGLNYPRDGWDDMFDVVVISGEVGMRKPETRIFELTAQQLQVELHECVFVDDLRHNVDAAVALGMIGVHHTSYDLTALELHALFPPPA